MLVTQQDVDKRAQLLLTQHSAQEKRINIKAHDKGLELLKVGDIINMDFRTENEIKKIKGDKIKEKGNICFK